MKLCLHLFNLTFATKMNVGIMLNKASMHDYKGLMEYSNESNKILLFTHVKFVMENLTSIYLLPDVIVIKDLKVNVRRKYNRLLSTKKKE